jgi:hypothetical protein
VSVERTIRCIRGSGTLELEHVWDAMAAQGWRLIGSTSAAASPIDVYVWLFFERATSEPLGQGHVEPDRRVSSA